MRARTRMGGRSEGDRGTSSAARDSEWKTRPIGSCEEERGSREEERHDYSSFLAVVWVNRWTFSSPLSSSSPPSHHHFLFILGTENAMGRGSFAVM